MTQGNEQYRAGFEAAMRKEFGDDLSFDRDDQGYISDSWRDAFIGWTASKLEASTEPARYHMDHGVLHDRVTGQHMWTQDQYDEQWRDMYRAGQEDAAAGYNMLTGKMIEGAERPDALDAARYRNEQRSMIIGQAVAHYGCRWPIKSGPLYFNGVRITRAEFNERAAIATSTAQGDK